VSARGRFIVLEGIDGAGTTTQSRRLADALASRGIDVFLTCEPSSGPVGKLIRKALRRDLGDEPVRPPDPDATLVDASAPELARRGNAGSRELPWSSMALLFAADRLDHVAYVVEPALAAGKTVISDRYVLSSLTSQSVTSPEGESSLPFISAINGRALHPDLTLVFDVDPAVAEDRRNQRGGPPELYEVRDIQRRLAAAYARAEELVPGDRVVHIADGTPDEVFARILEAALPAG
jgi:dTMP kinase